jgi:hypothetical protein
METYTENNSLKKLVLKYLILYLYSIAIWFVINYFLKVYIKK